MFKKIKFRELTEDNLELLKSGSNLEYKSSTIIEGLLTSIWCGANRFLHTEVNRHNIALGAYFEKINGNLVLKIALNKKLMAWFDGLWNYSKSYNFKFDICNA